MSSKLYSKLFTQNNWNLDDIPSTTYRRYIDKWDVSGEYPFKITQQFTEEYTEEHLDHLSKMSDKEKMLLKMNMNAMYGMFGGITPTSSNMYYSSAGGSVGFNHTGLKSLYYKNGKAQESRTVPHEETAVCIQKENLIKHFKHKLTKTSKKKNEFQSLTNIIEMYQNEIAIYMEDFPERFI